MKKILAIFSFLAAVMLASSCQKELPDDIKIEVNKGGQDGQSQTPTSTPTPELKVSEPGLFSAKGGQQTITITATEAWTLSKSAESDWLTVKTTSGKAGTTQVDLEVTENTSLSERTATVTVQSEAGDQTVKIIQSGASPVLQLNKNDLSFTSPGGNDSFTITSNTAWTIVCDQPWCTLSSSSGSNNATVTVNVSENTSPDSRSATITVKAGDMSQTIVVTQAGANVTLQLSKTSMAFNSSKESDSFTITSNTAWTIVSDQPWCALSSSSGSNDATVTVNVSENASTDSRSGTITVTAADLLLTIVVTQAGAIPTYQRVETFTVNGVSFNMVRVEGGTFTMGATSEQRNDQNSDELPTHHVTLSTYYIGETEVTQELWQAVMGSNPSYFSGYGLPVEQVSWNDCQKFITRLNSLTGNQFRLPTEAEWEFAARGGNKSLGYKYAGSNNIDDVAWYGENSNKKTHKVAQKSPNELGVYDMSGNVWELCQDWYGKYSSGSQKDPTGSASGSDRVTRGGGWQDGMRHSRVSSRGIDKPDNRNNSLGLRLALSY